MPAGSAPGERRGGRQKGTPNKSPAGLRKALAAQRELNVADALQLAELALPHVPMALETLIDVATTGQSESARIAAANSILDRAHGKAAQVVAGDPNKPINVDVRHAIVELVRVIASGKDYGR